MPLFSTPITDVNPISYTPKYNILFQPDDGQLGNGRNM